MECEHCHSQKKIEESGNSFRREIVGIAIISTLYLLAEIFQTEMLKWGIPDLEYIVFGVIYLLMGWRVLVTAAGNLLRGKVLDEYFLMSIATLGAFAIRSFSEAVAVMLFFRVGELLQSVTVNKTRKQIHALLEIRPDYANIMEGEEIRRMDPGCIPVGSLILVKPGEKVPLDGVVLSGTSLLDTSPLTGEPMPKRITTGDQVFSGMLNKTGLLRVRVTRLYQDSSAAKILDLVENAASKKAPTDRWITRFARVYTPAVVFLSALIASVPPLVFQDELFSTWLYRALVILVVSCPCALLVSVPLGYFGGLGAASRNGILIKGANILDSLKNLRTLVFDKTGTLTLGVFQVNRVVAQGGYSEKEIIRYAAAAETYSTHPIAACIRDHCDEKNPPGPIGSHEEIQGMGVRAQVGDVSVLVGNDRLLHHEKIAHGVCDVGSISVHVAINGKYAGYLLIGDEIRTGTKALIRELRDLGVKRIALLTGDGKESAQAVAEEAEIDEFHTELLPADKLALLERIISEEPAGDKCAFVGDGINDAPVLARADVGISMGGIGTDVAIETSDVVLMQDSLEKIPMAIRISRKTHMIIIQNIILALGVKVLFVFLGTVGVATMWEAVFGDMGVALLAILNSMRAYRMTAERGKAAV